MNKKIKLHKNASSNFMKKNILRDLKREKGILEKKVADNVSHVENGFISQRAADDDSRKLREITEYLESLEA